MLIWMPRIHAGMLMWSPIASYLLPCNLTIANRHCLMVDSCPPLHTLLYRMQVSVCLHMWTHLHTHAHTHACTHSNTHTHTNTHTNTHVQSHTNTHVHAHSNTHMHFLQHCTHCSYTMLTTHTHTYMHTFAHATFAHTHTQARISTLIDLLVMAERMNEQHRALKAAQKERIFTHTQHSNNTHKHYKHAYLHSQICWSWRSA